MHPRYLLPLLILFACSSAPSTVKKTASALTPQDRQLCDSLQLDDSLVSSLRDKTKSPFEAFHYSFTTEYKNGKQIEIDPVHAQGLVFHEPEETSESLVHQLYYPFHEKGYSLFLLDQDKIGLLKTPSKYEVLRLVRTDGINAGIDNDSLQKIIKRFDEKYSLDLVGAGGDWCDFVVRKEPADWLTFAKEVYKVCPDVVEQGTGTIDELAAEMKKGRRLYLWWD